MFCERLSPTSSSCERPKRSETSSWIDLIETCAASPWGKTSLRTSWASSTDIGRPVSDENATTRVSAPSNSRVFEELNVVDQQQVVGPVALLEALDALVAERVDEVVHEGFARDVANGEVARVLGDVVGDRLEE